ncbi:MAG: plastocyanin/azurin family copper-binding protein [Dokdonella sp.]
MPARACAGWGSRARNAAAIAAAYCCTAQAAIHVVTANPDLTFTPAAITIYQGDTIAFENAGGVHNVHADNNRFICSVNCSTNNAPNAAMWRADVQFRQLGTFGYFCDAHGDLGSGMRGAVTVIDRIFVDGFDLAADSPGG